MADSDSQYAEWGGENQRITKTQNILPIWGNKETMNLNSLILDNIRNSPYFKTTLFSLKTYHEVLDEIYYNVNHLEPWERGSRKMVGSGGARAMEVRGVSSGGIVSTAYCILYKLFTLKLTRKQLYALINHADSPYIRGIGFMYIRYTQPPKDLWDWYEPYLDDEEEIDPRAGQGDQMTVGQMLNLFLKKLDWYSTLFPRIPVPAQKAMEENFRERAKQMEENQAEEEEEEPMEAAPPDSSSLPKDVQSVPADSSAEDKFPDRADSSHRLSHRSRSKSKDRRDRSKDHRQSPKTSRRTSRSRSRKRSRRSDSRSRKRHSRSRERRRSRSRDRSRKHEERKDRKRKKRSKSRDRHRSGSTKKKRQNGSRDRSGSRDRDRKRHKRRRSRSHSKDKRRRSRERRRRTKSRSRSDSGQRAKRKHKISENHPEKSRSPKKEKSQSVNVERAIEEGKKSSSKSRSCSPKPQAQSKRETDKKETRDRMSDKEDANENGQKSGSVSPNSVEPPRADVEPLPVKGQSNKHSEDPASSNGKSPSRISEESGADNSPDLGSRDDQKLCIERESQSSTEQEVVPEKEEVDAIPVEKNDSNSTIAVSKPGRSICETGMSGMDAVAAYSGSESGQSTPEKRKSPAPPKKAEKVDRSNEETFQPSHRHRGTEKKRHSKTHSSSKRSKDKKYRKRSNSRESS